MANELASLASTPVGAGLANLAKSTISLRKQYTQYANDTMESGQAPLPFEEWVKSTGNS